jgi:hypothetical protein
MEKHIEGRKQLVGRALHCSSELIKVINDLRALKGRAEAICADCDLIDALDRAIDIALRERNTLTNIN